MYILRVKTVNDKGEAKIQTLPFNTEDGAIKGAGWVMKTSAAGFIAESESIDSTHGRIIKKWDHTSKYGYASLHYTVQSGAYKDTVSATLGTEQDCLAMASECNAKCQGWFDRSARVEHLVGPLWQTVFTDPYLD